MSQRKLKKMGPNTCFMLVRTIFLWMPLYWSSILALVFVILILLALALVHYLLAIRINGKLLNTVSVLALDTVAAEAGLRPVLAHLALVHGPLHERLAGEGWRGGRAVAACAG